jgi:hypothetical protein
MFTFPNSRRQTDRPAARRLRTCRPLIEDLEGRRLPSGIAGNHIGTSVASVVLRKSGGAAVTLAIVGDHPGMNVALAEKAYAHANPDIVGDHPGMNVVQAMLKAPGTSADIVGNHIGTSASDAARAGVSHEDTYTVRFYGN